MNIKHESKDIYFVWTKTGHRPRRAHMTKESALSEAERLAALCPSKKFLVMHFFAKVSAKPAVNAESAITPMGIAA